MSPGVVLSGYHRHGSGPIFLKKAQVRLRTAGCWEGWTPEAARRVGRLSVVLARAESQERSAVVRVEAWTLKQEMFNGLRGSPTPRAEGVRRQTQGVQVSFECDMTQAEAGDDCCSLHPFT
ncbi:hypothetical protein E2C01_047883 [Portunus trituberculatus]|uniref:Uncharacterized protein n=1 Tax=Portunus trituberculatus TaxID=210409 RepID=A0A5B7GA19_PORTR|nr:hypothetical protein [Portunus trituberculatus]